MAACVFKRTEKKYLLTAAQYEALRAALGDALQPEPYAAYTICNVYYDTEHDELIRASIEKPVFKEKLRLRSYGVPDAQSGVFLELKRKYQGVVYKRRIELPLAEAERFAATGELSAPHPEIAPQLIEELRYFLRLHKPVPKLFLAYEREAFHLAEDSTVRMTFDTNIRSRTENVSPKHGDRGTPLAEGGWHLLELKANGAIPVWLAELLAQQGIFPASFSKYGRVFEKRLAQQQRAITEQGNRRVAPARALSGGARRRIYV